MVNLLIAVVFLLMYQNVVCAEFRFDYFKRVVVEEKMDISWSIANVSSKLKCTTLCLAKNECVTLGFVKAKGSCQAFSPGVRGSMGKHGFTAYYSKRRSASMHRLCNYDKDCYGKRSLCSRGRCMCDPEFIYNTLKQACVIKPVGMHQPCMNKDQCYINGSVCFKGKCMCTPGLSYHKAEQACVRECSKYGETMSIYEGLGIVSHNKEKLLEYSSKKCIERCTASTDFECLSVDMKPKDGTCCLSIYGYLDVNGKYRESGADGWLLGTRDCAFD